MNPASNETQLRQDLARYSRRVWERGWVANHDGNLSVRLRRGRLMCTPTGLSKGELAASQMLVTDETGKVLSGRLRPFSELNLHLACYHARPDVGAVLHAHPPTATGYGAAGAALDRPFLPEAVVSLGPVIPTVELALPGEPAALAIAPYLDEHDALLLAGNGVVTCGDDLEMAYLRMELVEHLCRIDLVARQLGGARPLAPHQLEPLLRARARAGLGPEARGGSTTPPPEEPPSRAAGEELKELIRAEIKRVLE